MPNLPSSREQVTHAICTCLSLTDLRLAVRSHLDRDIDEIVLADNKITMVERVVDYAIRLGEKGSLVEGVLAQNPRPDLQELLKAWLAEGEPSLHFSGHKVEVIPAWALTTQGKVQLVRGLRRGFVDGFLVSHDLRYSFPKSLDAVSSAGIVQAANALRCKVDPEFEPAGMIIEALPLYGYDDQAYWQRAFDKACALGGRMLGALLVSTPSNLYEAKRQEIEQLLYDLRDISS